MVIGFMLNFYDTYLDYGSCLSCEVFVLVVQSFFG